MNSFAKIFLIFVLLSPGIACFVVRLGIPSYVHVDMRVTNVTDVDNTFTYVGSCDKTVCTLSTKVNHSNAQHIVVCHAVDTVNVPFIVFDECPTTDSTILLIMSFVFFGLAALVFTVWIVCSVRKPKQTTSFPENDNI